MNTWPNGYKQALTPDQHEAWNGSRYPGTRQLCALCEQPTGRCEEDSIYIDDDTGPVCRECEAATTTQGKA